MCHLERWKKLTFKSRPKVIACRSSGDYSRALWVALRGVRRMAHHAMVCITILCGSGFGNQMACFPDLAQETFFGDVVWRLGVGYRIGK